MKKSVFILLLVLCFLIPMTVAAVDQPGPTNFLGITTGIEGVRADSFEIGYICENKTDLFVYSKTTEFPVYNTVINKDNIADTSFQVDNYLYLIRANKNLNTINGEYLYFTDTL